MGVNSNGSRENTNLVEKASKYLSRIDWNQIYIGKNGTISNGSGGGCEHDTKFHRGISSETKGESVSSGLDGEEANNKSTTNLVGHGANAEATTNSTLTDATIDTNINSRLTSPPNDGDPEESPSRGYNDESNNQLSQIWSGRGDKQYIDDNDGSDIFNGPGQNSACRAEVKLANSAGGRSVCGDCDCWRERYCCDCGCCPFAANYLTDSKQVSQCNGQYSSKHYHHLADLYRRVELIARQTNAKLKGGASFELDGKIGSKSNSNSDSNNNNNHQFHSTLTSPNDHLFGPASAETARKPPPPTTTTKTTTTISLSERKRYEADETDVPPLAGSQPCVSLARNVSRADQLTRLLPRDSAGPMEQASRGPVGEVDATTSPESDTNFAATNIKSAISSGRLNRAADVATSSGFQWIQRRTPPEYRCPLRDIGNGYGVGIDKKVRLLGGCELNKSCTVQDIGEETRVPRGGIACSYDATTFGSKVDQFNKSRPPGATARAAAAAGAAVVARGQRDERELMARSRVLAKENKEQVVASGGRRHCHHDQCDSNDDGNSDRGDQCRPCRFGPTQLLPIPRSCRGSGYNTFASSKCWRQERTQQLCQDRRPRQQEQSSSSVPLAGEDLRAITSSSVGGQQIQWQQQDEQQRLAMEQLDRRQRCDIPYRGHRPCAGRWRAGAEVESNYVRNRGAVVVAGSCELHCKCHNHSHGEDLKTSGWPIGECGRGARRCLLAERAPAGRAEQEASGSNRGGGGGGGSSRRERNNKLGIELSTNNDVRGRGELLASQQHDGKSAEVSSFEWPAHCRACCGQCQPLSLGLVRETRICLADCKWFCCQRLPLPSAAPTSLALNQRHDVEEEELPCSCKCDRSHRFQLTHLLLNEKPMPKEEANRRKLNSKHEVAAGSVESVEFAKSIGLSSSRVVANLQLKGKSTLAATLAATSITTTTTATATASDTTAAQMSSAPSSREIEEEEEEEEATTKSGLNLVVDASGLEQRGERLEPEVDLAISAGSEFGSVGDHNNYGSMPATFSSHQPPKSCINGQVTDFGGGRDVDGENEAKFMASVNRSWQRNRALNNNRYDCNDGSGSGDETPLNSQTETVSQSRSAAIYYNGANSFDNTTSANVNPGRHQARDQIRGDIFELSRAMSSALSFHASGSSERNTTSTDDTNVYYTPEHRGDDKQRGVEQGEQLHAINGATEALQAEARDQHAKSAKTNMEAGHNSESELAQHSKLANFSLGHEAAGNSGNQVEGVAAGSVATKSLGPIEDEKTKLAKVAHVGRPENGSSGSGEREAATTTDAPKGNGCTSLLFGHATDPKQRGNEETHHPKPAENSFSFGAERGKRDFEAPLNSPLGSTLIDSPETSGATGRSEPLAAPDLASNITAIANDTDCLGVDGPDGEAVGVATSTSAVAFVASSAVGAAAATFQPTATESGPILDSESPLPEVGDKVSPSSSSTTEAATAIPTKESDLELKLHLQPQWQLQSLPADSGDKRTDNSAEWEQEKGERVAASTAGDQEPKPEPVLEASSLATMKPASPPEVGSDATEFAHVGAIGGGDGAAVAIDATDNGDPSKLATNNFESKAEAKIGVGFGVGGQYEQNQLASSRIDGAQLCAPEAGLKLPQPAELYGNDEEDLNEPQERESLASSPEGKQSICAPVSSNSAEEGEEKKVAAIEIEDFARDGRGSKLAAVVAVPIGADWRVSQSSRRSQLAASGGRTICCGQTGAGGQRKFAQEKILDGDLASDEDNDALDDGHDYDHDASDRGANSLESLAGSEGLAMDSSGSMEAARSIERSEQPPVVMDCAPSPEPPVSLQGASKRLKSILKLTGNKNNATTKSNELQSKETIAGQFEEQSDQVEGRQRRRRSLVRFSEQNSILELSPTSSVDGHLGGGSLVVATTQVDPGDQVDVEKNQLAQDYLRA